MSAQRTNQTLKMLAVFMEHFRCFFKLATEDMQWVIKNPTEAIALFVEAIKDHRFSIWKTIRLGTGLKTADDFSQDITDAGGRASNLAKNIMGKPSFTVSRELIKLDLVKVSVADLGFLKNVSLEEIYNRVISRGLKLLPAEAGPQLRLQYVDQPNGERLFMAMEPIKDSNGVLHVFDVKRGDYLWLDAHYAYPSRVWLSEDIFVFCK